MKIYENIIPLHCNISSKIELIQLIQDICNIETTYLKIEKKYVKKHEKIFR